MKLILASASPRRKELLRHFWLSFMNMPALQEEERKGDTPDQIVEHLSYQKAVEGCGRLTEKGETDFTVIGADTLVSCFGHILGKPADKREAAEMLHTLQGQSHQVYTGVTLAWKINDLPSMFATFHECTDVTVFPMTDEEIAAYVDSGEPMDKAGAYAIQGRFAAYIQGICGDYSNVVGLPVGRVYQELLKRNLLP